MKASLVLLTLAGLCGCAHAHAISSVPSAQLIKHFNSSASQPHVTLEKADGESMVVVRPMIIASAVMWYESATQRPVQLPFSEIRQLGFKNSGRGALEGTLYGAGVGVALSSIVFVGVAGVCQGGPCSIRSRLPVFLLALPTTLIGAAIGGGMARETFVVSNGSTNPPRR